MLSPDKKNVLLRYEHDRGVYRSTPDTAGIFATYPATHPHNIIFRLGTSMIGVRTAPPPIRPVSFATYPATHPHNIIFCIGMSMIAVRIAPPRIRRGSLPPTRPRTSPGPEGRAISSWALPSCCSASVPSPTSGT